MRSHNAKPLAVFAVAMTLATGCANKAKPPLPAVDDRLSPLSDAIDAHFKRDETVSKSVNSAADHIANIRRELQR